MKVTFTAEALRNLQEIGDYIAESSPVRARTFMRELREKALGIGRAPNGFPRLESFSEEPVRRRVHGNYLILYTVEDDRVLILFIVHGARDYAALLFPDG